MSCEPIHLLSNLYQPERITVNDIVIDDQARKIRYGEMLSMIESMTRYLASCGVGPGDRVALLLPRNWQSVIAIFSVLYLGAAYVPIDIRFPAARQTYIINDAVVKAVIGLKYHNAECQAPIYDFDVLLNDQQDKLIPQNFQFVDHRPAAILYTSGSTGYPKGVVHTGRSLFAFASWAAQTFQVGAQSRIASLAPMFFDLSTFDLFAPLMFGGQIHLVPEHIVAFPYQFSKWFEQHKISHFYSVPTFLSYWARKGKLAEFDLSHFKTLLFAGEPFPIAPLQALCQQLPNVNLFNLYGPTETNVSTYWPVNWSTLSQNHLLPIGIPASNAQLMIKEGLLYVKGPSVMQGYWRGGQLDMSKLNDGWYCTNDRVELLYKGRQDRMVKVNGYRIELDEIEKVIYTSGLVELCAVVVKANRFKTLCAYFTPKAVDFELSHLKGYLKRYLPEYMMPTHFKAIDNFPKLPNGKIHLKQLEALPDGCFVAA